MWRHDGREAGLLAGLPRRSLKSRARHRFAPVVLIVPLMLLFRRDVLPGVRDLQRVEPYALFLPVALARGGVSRGRDARIADEGLLGLGFPLAPGGPRRLVPRALHARTSWFGIYLAGSVLSQALTAAGTLTMPSARSLTR